MHVGEVEAGFAYLWIVAVSFASAATLRLWLGARNNVENSRTRRRFAYLLVVALALPAASLTAALYCLNFRGASTLSQYNDETTLPIHKLWGLLWFVFVPGMPLTTLVAVRALVLALRPLRAGLVISSLLVIGAAIVSWYAVVENFPST